MKSLARLWSRVPIFLQILIYGSIGLAGIVFVALQKVEMRQRPCHMAMAAEAPAWRALGDHLDRWYAEHPLREPSLPDGGLDFHQLGLNLLPRMSASGCRDMAEQLENQVFSAIYIGAAPDEADAEGQRMWRTIETLRAQRLSACL